MSRRARLGILFVLFGLVLAILGIFVVMNIVRQSLAPLPPAATPTLITERVLVTTHDLPLGAVLREGDVTEMDVPPELVPLGALTDPGQVIGRITKIPLVSGELLLPHHLADPTNVQHDLGFVLSDDQVLMAFPADDLMSRLNMLEPGDLVDILASLTIEYETDDIGAEEEEDKLERVFSFDALQRVAIQAVVVEIVQPDEPDAGGVAGEVVPGAEATPQPTPTPAPSDVTSYAILVAVSPQDALVLKNLKDSDAVFDIVLRSPTSTQNFELDPVMLEYLVDRYRLIIPLQPR